MENSPDNRSTKAATSPEMPESTRSDGWIAGVRYPSGTEIWCAGRAGDPAWTPDKKLAARYSSESIAAMAARQLTEGDAVPFWTAPDKEQPMSF